MITNITIPRMETIKKTAKLFGLPEHFVRKKILDGEIVAVKAGCKYLVNVDKFAEYLNTCTAGAEHPENASGIAPIPVKL